MKRIMTSAIVIIPLLAHSQMIDLHLKSDSSALKREFIVSYDDLSIQGKRNNYLYSELIAVLFFEQPEGELTSYLNSNQVKVIDRYSKQQVNLRIETYQQQKQIGTTLQIIGASFFTAYMINGSRNNPVSSTNYDSYIRTQKTLGIGSGLFTLAGISISATLQKKINLSLSKN